MYSSILSIAESDVGNTGCAVNKRTLYENYPLHLHEFFEFEYILYGTATVVIDAHEYKVSAGDLIFCTPLSIQALNGVTNKLDVINVNFTVDYIDAQFLSELSNGRVIKSFPKTLIELLVEESDRSNNTSDNTRNNTEFSQQYTKSLITLILIEIIRRKQSDNELYTRGAKQTVAQQIASYIQLHYREPITLKSVASYFGYTSNHVSIIFYNTFSMSIPQYITKTRLKQSTKLLLNSSLSATAVGIECGFTSTPTFFRAFRKEYGVSPKEFLNNNVNNNKTV